MQDLISIFANQLDAGDQNTIEHRRVPHVYSFYDIHQEQKECELLRLMDNLTFCENRYITEFIKVD